MLLLKKDALALLPGNDGELQKQNAGAVVMDKDENTSLSPILRL